MRQKLFKMNQKDSNLVTNDSETASHQPSKTLRMNYWKFLSAVGISDFGDGATLIAVPWLATHLTSNAFEVSLVATAMRLPWLFFSLPAGVIIDRLSRKRLMVVMLVLRAIIIAFLALAVFQNWVSIPGLVLLAFLLGSTEVLFDSTAQTMTPSLVHSEHLVQANGHIRTVQLLANDILARPIGGLLITFGLFLPFTLDAFTAILAVLLLLSIPGSFQAEKTNKPSNFKAEIAEGLKYLWHNAMLRHLALISISLNTTYAAVLAMQVFFVQEVIKLDSIGFGILIATAVVGSVLGSQSVAWLKRRIGIKYLMGISLLGTGIPLGLVGLTSLWFVVILLYLISSFFVVIWSITNISLRQSLVPDGLLGRVGSVFRLLSWGVTPIGVLLGGLLVSFGQNIIGRDSALRLPNFVLGITYITVFLFLLRLWKSWDKVAIK